MRCGRLLELLCGVQHYAWGQRTTPDHRPYIAELVGADARPGEPFAELWIGAHAKLPAQVLMPDGPVPLDRLISENPKQFLGAGLVKRGFRSLPFLLKVLDCGAPLSIQAHPDLELAAQLHARDPDHYPDANHKPEIAIALTPSRTLSGFRPRREIQADISRLPPLSALLSPALADVDPTGAGWLRRAYAELFRPPAEVIAEGVGALRAELQGSTLLTPGDECFLYLDQHFPGERGTLSAYFLNLVQLSPGEALFTGADVPHAYLGGTLIECMVNSDNVVRAGLTPKFVDAQVLLDMLTYVEGRPETQTGQGDDDRVKTYPVPVPDFEVSIISLRDRDSIAVKPGGTASLLLVLEGRAELREPRGQTTVAHKGSTWILPAEAGGVTASTDAGGVRIVRATAAVD